MIVGLKSILAICLIDQGCREDLEMEIELALRFVAPLFHEPVWLQCLSYWRMATSGEISLVRLVETLELCYLSGPRSRIAA